MLSINETVNVKMGPVVEDDFAHIRHIVSIDLIDPIGELSSLVMIYWLRLLSQLD